MYTCSSEGPVIAETTPAPRPRRGNEPCFIDGQVTSKTYLVVASKPEDQATTYNAIGIRRLENDRFRWHCYPNWGFFNLTEPVMGTRQTQRNAYHTSILTREHTVELLSTLKFQRGLVVAPEDKIMEVLGRGYRYDLDHTE